MSDDMFRILTFDTMVPPDTFGMPLHLHEMLMDFHGAPAPTDDAARTLVSPKTPTGPQQHD